MKKPFIVVICFLWGCSPSGETEQGPMQVTQASVDASGLVIDEDLPLVLANCTPCHSAKLVSQNRATREGWQEMIRWMQKTQNLWDLGKNEPKILDYLEKNYGPEDTGRRKQLVLTEWYTLE